MNREISEQLWEIITIDGGANWGTTILGISQENLDDEVATAIENGWDIKSAIDECKDIRGNLQRITKDMVAHIYVAKTLLADKNNGYEMNFEQFCEAIGITKQTANSWIREWRDPEGAKNAKEKAQKTRDENIILNNAENTIDRIGMSIYKIEDDSIEIEINYLGKIFYKRLKI